MRTMTTFALLILSISYIHLFAEPIPEDRITDWSNAGLINNFGEDYPTILASERGFINDGGTSNDVAMDNLLAEIGDTPIILYFDTGEYLFNKAITLPSNFILLGKGAEYTNLIFDQTDNKHSIICRGKIANNKDTVSNAISISDSILFVDDASNYSIGDWFRLEQDDEEYITSDWAKGSVGQIIQIKDITGNQIHLNSKIRLDYPLDKNPRIIKIDPIKNIAIQCLKIDRRDDTAPTQTSNIYFENAINCYVKGIESYNCTYSHVQGRWCSNLWVYGSYMHHAYGYGGDGRGYGVVLSIMSNECLVENNIFERLRHSMILQAGANANVFSYNYSFDAYWTETSLPSNSSGDMVLHGNYNYLNLFEQNIGQNIVIDNSHGPNGKYNTFFRNRAEKWGIFFSADNSPGQNIVANEISNTSFPYNIVNYTILGDDHFLFANNNKGVLSPSTHNKTERLSYFYETKPDFLLENDFAGVGTPNSMSENSIPSKRRYLDGNIFGDICSGINHINEDKSDENCLVYPNPATDKINIKIKSKNKAALVAINIIDINGISQKELTLDYQNQISLSSSELKMGTYFILIKYANETYIKKIIISE